MKFADYFYLALFPVLLSGGQFFFKKAADSLVAYSVPRFLGSILSSPHFWAALLVYGFATLLWLFILSRMPLSKAIPFTALVFVIVPIISTVFFAEQLNLMYWIGAFVILIGVYITATALAI